MTGLPLSQRVLKMLHLVNSPQPRPFSSLLFSFCHLFHREETGLTSRHYVCSLTKEEERKKNCGFAIGLKEPTGARGPILALWSQWETVVSHLAHCTGVKRFDFSREQVGDDGTLGRCYSTKVVSAPVGGSGTPGLGCATTEWHSAGGMDCVCVLDRTV